MAVKNPASRGHKHKAASLLADTLTAQDILYVNASGDLALLPIGTEGQVLAVETGIVSWETAAASGISDIVEDTTPQLGGNLDMNGFTIGGIAEANLIDKSAAETITGQYTFNAQTNFVGRPVITEGRIKLESASPFVQLVESDATADNTKWGVQANAEQLHIFTMSDNEATTVDAVTINRTGTVVDNMSLTGHVNVTGQVNTIGGNHIRATASAGSDYIQISDTGSQAQVYSNNNPVYIYGNFSTHAAISASFNGPDVSVTGNISAATFQSIAAANLLDKSATETVAANWTFDTGNSNTTVVIGNNNVTGNRNGILQMFGEWTGVSYGFQISASSANVGFTGVGTDPVVNIQSSLSFDILGGKSLQIRDLTNADILNWSHDGTNVNQTYTTTTNHDYIGGTDHRFRDGAMVYVYDTTDTEYMRFVPGATQFNIESTQHIQLTPAVGHDVLLFRSTSTVGFRIYDGSGADYVRMSHDGTDFNIVGTNTTDINISGITALAAGTVDADFDAITATSFGGIAEANLLDASANETVTGAWSFGADVTLGESSPNLKWVETSVTADNARWRMIVNAEDFYFSVLNDAESVSTDIFVVSRTGTTVDAVAFAAPITASSTIAATGAVTGSNLNVSNWDTAFGWGDHAGGGYLTSETSHADVLVDADIGVTVQGYDVDTMKADVADTITANWIHTGSLGISDGTDNISFSAVAGVVSADGTGGISLLDFNVPVAANSLSLTTSLDETDGGTGQSTFTAGDILYASATNVLSKLAKGTDGEVLKLASGVPSWATEGGGVTSETAHKTADETVTSSTTVQNDDHIAFTGLTANTWYKVEGFFQVTGTTTTDWRSQWVFTQTPSDVGGIDHVGNNLSGTYTTDAGAFDGQMRYTFPTTGVYYIQMSGMFKTHASTGGDLQFKWAQDTSSGSATTVHAGSWVTITPM